MNVIQILYGDLHGSDRMEILNRKVNLPEITYKEIEDNQRAEEERQYEEKNSRRRELEIRAHSMSRTELEDEYVKLSIRLDESWEELQEAYRARWHH